MVIPYAEIGVATETPMLPRPHHAFTPSNYCRSSPQHRRTFTSTMLLLHHDRTTTYPICSAANARPSTVAVPLSKTMRYEQAIATSCAMQKCRYHNSIQKTTAIIVKLPYYSKAAASLLQHDVIHHRTTRHRHDHRVGEPPPQCHPLPLHATYRHPRKRRGYYNAALCTAPPLTGQNREPFAVEGTCCLCIDI